MRLYQRILAERLNERRLRNPQYSLRAFARSIEISPAHLSNLISGRKKLTLKLANKIIEKLQLNSDERIDLVRDIGIAINSNSEIPIEVLALSDNEFKLISEWYHLAILSIGNLKNRADAKWLGERLGISPHVAWDAFLRLKRLGFISVKNGRFNQSTKPLMTTTDVPSAAIRQYHRQNLELAMDKLDKVSPLKREYSSVTLSISSDKMSEAKKMINQFRQKFCQKIEDSETPSEVYTLAIQFFPVTHTK